MSTASSQSTGWIGVGASLVLHAMLAIWVWRLPPAVELLPPELAVNVAIEGALSSDVPGSQQRGAADPRAGGGLSAQNVDARDRGQGGDESGAVDVVFLVSRAHGATLQDSAWNAPRISQIQRIDTARERVSWENRRATPNPDDDPFLASGEGTHRERRPVATTDARAGVAADVRASARGGEADVHATVGDGAETAQSDRAGSDRDTPSRGILTGEGRRASEAANVAFGRPELDPGPAATLAPTTGRVRDDTRSELLAAQLVQSWVDSSERRGAQPGEGRGGVGGGGTPGSGGGRDEGGRASAYGPGGGGLDALDTSDRRYRTWYLAQRRRIEERLVFPRERAVALDMGLAVYRLSVRQDGALVASRRVRSSGFGDLDAAAAAAIAAAAPFDPLPPELARRDGVFDLDMTVRFANPLVN